MAQTFSTVNAKLPVDVIIGGVTYIVNSFNATTNTSTVEYTKSDGTSRGFYAFRTGDTATMQIQCEDAAEAKPETLTTFSYGPSGSAATWCILGNSDSIASAAPATWDLTLRAVSGSVIT